ncbi:Histone transcription regulator 3 [Myotisia sp. PD_48]|nr:Histone transcription regulator 3 [Myotisia sp. PD_48]
MSNFTALNIEPDDVPEEELDDTKEIQIEEALKLYQNALKLHSQGPKFYQEAAKAYEDLFKSEIFKYPEAISEYKDSLIWSSEYGEHDELEETSATTGTVVGDAQTTTSALPQTIYLSYKNYGQFLLDSFKYSSEQERNSAGNYTSITSAIKHFAKALEQDDSDTEFWRKCARVGDALKSHRISRFCLESVFDTDEGGIDEGFEQLRIEQAGAIGDLKRILSALDDQSSLSQLPSKQPRRSLLHLLRKQMDPFPFLPSAVSNLNGNLISNCSPLNKHGHSIITPAARTWTALSKSIFGLLKDASSDDHAFGLHNVVRIDLPTSIVDGPENLSPILRADRALPHNNEDNVMEDTDEANHGLSSVGNGDVVRENSVAADFDTSNGLPANDLEGAASTERVLPQHGAESAVQLNEAKVKLICPIVDEAEIKPSLPQSRKRSSASIIPEEPADGGRTKSKRIRARESNAEAHVQQDDVVIDQSRYFEDRLEIYTQADEWMFSTANDLLSKFGVDNLGTISQIKELSQMSPASNVLVESVALQDLRSVLENWNEHLGQVALHSDIFASAQDGLKNTARSGLSVFLEHSRQSNAKSGLESSLSETEELIYFSEKINSAEFSVQEVVFKWLEQHVRPVYLVSKKYDLNNVTNSNYAAHRFSPEMKDFLVQMMLYADEFVYRKLTGLMTSLEEVIVAQVHGTIYELTPEDMVNVEMAQSLYELHCDIYGSILTQSTEDSQSLKILQEDRLNRWRSLAHSFLCCFINTHQKVDGKHATLILRYRWATTCHANLVDDANRDYVLECLGSIKNAMELVGSPIISLVNNATMPEISIAAIDQEVSRLNAMGYFTDIFGSGVSDPVHLIESIEPVLDPSSVEFVAQNIENGTTDNTAFAEYQNLANFLNKGDATLRLFLLRRLREAYKSIQYPTKFVSCSLRSIETIVRELTCPTYLELASNERQSSLLKWLKLADDTLSGITRKVIEEPEISFECFDGNHLQTSMSALAQLSKLLQSFALYEDGVRVGQLSIPHVRSSKSLEQYREKLRGMLVKTWTVQYTLLREGIQQNKELFDTPIDDRIHFLRAVHNALGLRSYCKYSKKMFLKLMKNELLTLKTEELYDTDIAQVLFDLYRLKFSSDLDISLDHDCPEEPLDQASALMLTDFAMTQANRMNIKDFLKSDLKSTVDKIQRMIGWIGKSSPALVFNKRILSGFLKSPINPLQLFRSAQGACEVSMIPVHAKSSKLAEKGWYALLGLSALTKFRMQKKLGPTPTDDLDLAASFFRHDLEHGESRWETWYRLAQVYDLKLEEDIAWSADKLNNHREDLAVLERRAIHAYSMALAVAVRIADFTPDSQRLMSELYTHFGFRIYASSREPLSMGAFSVNDFMRHFNDGESQRMYEGKPFEDMKPFAAWNFASYLFRKAMVDRPMNWIKCLWKMFCSTDPQKERYQPIEAVDILDSLSVAIGALPKKRDGRSDPILEPHFKLASIIHKLVNRGDMDPEQASLNLISTPWARKLTPVKDQESWKPFILEVLKNLRNADKSNWHHRIVVRAAHILYDDSKDRDAAVAAKNDLTQHIFTKTMTVQVWRPENERAGRHFVYTTRYVYFFVHLLDQLDDRTNFDMLIRRVRRKINDYLNYAKLWEDICSTYIRLLRRVGAVSEGNEEVIFKPVSHDDFVLYSGYLDTWCQNQAGEVPLIELLRDAVELKKLNGTLMKSAMFDDLVADIYALLYKNTLPELMAAEEENRKQTQAGQLTAFQKVERTETPPVPGPKPRAKGVTRKEVQRKADAIAAKAANSRAATKLSKLNEDDRQHPDRQTIDQIEQQIENLQLPQDELHEQQQHEQQDEPQAVHQEATQKSDTQLPGSENNKETLTEDGNNEDIQGMLFEQAASAPATIHETSDDESELSEFDASRLPEDMKAISPMFPSLIKSGAPSVNPGSELSTVVSADIGDNESGPTASMQDAKSELIERQSDKDHQDD